MSICHLAELDNDMLYLYGPGSLDALDRNWGNQAVQAVTAISFKFIDFDLIVPQLYKIRARFPSLVVSMFRFANISIAGIFLENNETSICPSTRNDLSINVATKNQSNLQSQNTFKIKWANGN